MHEWKEMNNNLDKIFSPDGHITEATLLQYASGQLSPVEQHKVERHTMGCDLCADVLEGFMNVKKKEEIPSIISSLNKKILERAGAGVEPKIIRPNFRPYYSVAAGLILVLGLGWIFLQQGADEMMKNELSEDVSNESPSSADVLDSSVLLNDSLKTISGKDMPDKSIVISENLKNNSNQQDEMLGFNAGPPPVEESVTLSKTQEGDDAPTVVDAPKDANKKSAELDKTDNEKPVDNSKVSGSGNIYGKFETKAPKADAPNKDQPGKNEEDGKKEKGKELRSNEELKKQKLEEQENIVLTEKEVKDRKKHVTKSGELNNAPEYKTVPSQPLPNVNTVSTTEDADLKQNTDTISAYTGYYSDGQSLYDKKDFGKSVLEFEKILAKNPGDQKARYLCGSAYLESNKPDSALVHFNEILKTPASPYYQDAELGTAKAYLQKKDNAKAKLMLEKIISSGGKNKAKAEDELEKVK